MEKIMYTLPVNILKNNYRIYIGTGMFDCFGPYFSKYPKIALVTNDTVHELYSDYIAKLMETYPNMFLVRFPDGEKYKDLTTLNGVFHRFIEEQLGRDGLVIGLGGGVVGDVTGFAAATYMRGVDFILIPTTLLSMVDSSIGGKTAVNLPAGKNLVGSFYQPAAVFCDLDFLNTLPEREFNAGFMEVIKYGLIMDQEFYRYLLENKKEIKGQELEAIAYIVMKSCSFKGEVVEKDEKEEGLRSILNFGHTVGHALESYTDYSYYLHGEAVAIGALFIMSYLKDHGVVNDEDLDGFYELLEYFDLPVTIPSDFDVESIVRNLSYDKKNRGGKVLWVILKQIGIAAWGQFIDVQSVEKVLKRLRK